LKSNVVHSQPSSAKAALILSTVSAPKSTADTKAAAVERVNPLKPNEFQPSSAIEAASASLAFVSAPESTTQAMDAQKSATLITVQQSQYSSEAQIAAVKPPIHFKSNVDHSQPSSAKGALILSTVSAPKSTADDVAAEQVIHSKLNAFQQSSSNEAARVSITSVSSPELTTQEKDVQKTATLLTAHQSHSVLEAKTLEHTIHFETNVGHSQQSSGEEPAALTTFSSPISPIDAKAAVERAHLSTQK
jgi:hypothetical protein